jgi:hypothetical protein
MPASQQKERSMNDTVTVTAPRPRRRAGYRFGPHPVEIDRALLTDAQWEALKTDPFLRVSVETVDAPEVVAPVEAQRPSPQAQTQDASAASPTSAMKQAKPKKS